MIDLKEFEYCRTGVERKRAIRDRYPDHFQKILDLGNRENLKTFSEALYLYTRTIEEGDVGRCKGCEKRARFISLNRGYGSFCSLICSNKTNESQRLKTMMERYGVLYPLHSKELRERLKQSNLKNHGVEHYYQSKAFKDAVRKTSQERYGTDHHTQAEVNKKKMEKAWIRNWGKKNVLHHPLIKERVRKTMLERYGCENPAYINIDEELRDYIHMESWWRGLYIEDGMTVKEIVEETGLSIRFVYKQLAHFKLLNQEDIKVARSYDDVEMFKPIF